MNLNETLRFVLIKTASGTQRFLVRTANHYVLGEISFAFGPYGYVFTKTKKEVCILPEKEHIYAQQIENKIKELSERFQEIYIQGSQRPKNRTK